MRVHEILTESWEKDPHIQFHLSVEPNLIPGKPFSEQTRTNSSAGARGEAGGSGIYTTRNPQYWFTQLAYENVGDLPCNVYLVSVKEPSIGSTWAAHQDLSAPSDVIVLAKLMTVPDDEHLDVGKLFWLANKYLNSSATAVLTRWVNGEDLPTSEWAKLFASVEPQLAPSRPKAPVTLYRNEKPGTEQYSGFTSWSTDPDVAADYQPNKRKLVSAVIRPEDIVAYVPFFGPKVDWLNQKEMIVKPGHYNVTKLN